MKPLTQEELADRDQRRRESAAEYERLKQRWPTLRETMTPTAIVFAWLVMGDEAWERPAEVHTP